jgi:hypothetical protein
MLFQVFLVNIMRLLGRGEAEPVLTKGKNLVFQRRIASQERGSTPFGRSE